MTAGPNQRAIGDAMRRAFAKQGFMQTLGAKLTALGPGTCEIQVPFRPGVTQQHGFFHGGVTATLADNSAAGAAFTLFEEGRQPLTIEFKISYLAPASGEVLIARAEVLAPGRSVSHVRSDIFVVNGGEEHLVATALATIKSTSSVSEI
ncbi:MAG: PaaI family thioesterase [Pseudomonadota bacterium]